MTRKRSSLEIAADILRVAKKASRKSHLVYQANLNFQLINKYVKNLKLAGLLEGPAGRRFVYQTTEQGKEYLDQYLAFKELNDVSMVSYRTT